MKALVLHGPGHYEVEPDWPEPDPPPGWARVRVTHAGICGSDIPRFSTTGSYHHPMILGHEFTGVVETPAADSTQVDNGQRVAVLPIIPCGECAGCREHGPFHCLRYQFLGSRNDGGFAELCAVPEANLLALPDGVDERYGAFVEPLSVGLHTVRRSGFTAGSSALVFGAGPIGLLTAMWLRHLGASRVAVADVRPESLELARRIGFEQLIDPRDDDALSSLGSFEFVYEAAGARAALLGAIQVADREGVVTVIGRDSGDTVIPKDLFEMLMRKELRLVGCWGYDLRTDRDAVQQALGDPAFPLEHLITHQVPLTDAPPVIRQMIDRSIYYCKVMLDI